MGSAVNMMLTEKNDFEVSVTTGHNLVETVNALTAALKSQGYGVLGTIDVRKTMSEKTGKDVGDFMILDVCNPVHALNAMGLTDKAGLILPCKLSVQGNGKATRVSMMRPVKLIGLIHDSSLDSLAEQVEKELTDIMKTVVEA